MRNNPTIPLLALSLGLSSPARADLIVDHQPHPYGGSGSDTLFTTSLGQAFWQRVADDFTLAQPKTISSFSAWGFYDLDNPPASETMRVRLYRSRLTDGLPDAGNIVYEESFSSISRTDTGRHILDNSQREFFYQANLVTPVSLDAGTKYWFEFVQIGDITTAFRWETSVSDRNGYAFINPITIDWRSSLPNGDYGTAFQLISPEPASAALLATGLLYLARRHRSRKEGCEWK